MSSRVFWTQEGFTYHQSTPFQLALQALSYVVFIHFSSNFLSVAACFWILYTKKLRLHSVFR